MLRGETPTTTRLHLLFALALCAALLGGCFGGGGDDDEDTAGATDGAGDTADGATTDGATDGNTDGATGREGYPAGPYGVGEGETIADLEFVDTEGNPFSLGDIYADPSNQLILLSTAAGWCTACIEEQPKLQALSDEHDGLFVMVVYFEDAEFNPAEPSDALGWKERHELRLQVVTDTPFVMQSYYDASLTPLNMIIDVASMEIVWQTTGWDQTSIDAIINSRL